MTISFQCKQCGKQYKVSDDKGGKKIKCRQYEAVMKIPLPDGDDFLDDLDEGETEYTPHVRRRKKSPSKPAKPKRKNKAASGPKPGVLIALGVLVLLLGGGGYFLFTWSTPGGKMLKGITDKDDEIINSQGTGQSSQQVHQSDVDRMKKIGLAFHNYHDSFTRFPYADAHLVDGKPNLSWRVHLLPFLGEQELYHKFKLDEPWDSPHNKALLDQMPDVYQTQGATQPGSTSVMTFIGKGTPFNGGKGPQMRNFTDGASNVILAVKAGPDKAVPWTKPVDLPFNPGNPISALGQATDGKFLCFMGDGALKTIPTSISPQTLSLAIQHRDGQVLPVF
ncbi:DUF1559 family PulG-like putative transporter [Gimesia panareensis]|uniref:DUF1559 family PulG-like putative transporter n=1 Tax=Gimesia panareensis TaxID=2527978 RepID=UPI0011897F17|nr:DUF1559 domain-containing protein [Gimesia panareensis]QDU50790.1 hypothetical protein Pan110_31500 [Gimesia panareensis]